MQLVTQKIVKKYNKHSQCLISSYFHHEWNFNVTLRSIYLQITVFCYCSHCPSNILKVHILTYSMVQSPSWEANWFAASQEIPRISWNPKAHHRNHKHPPPVPILGQPNSVHIPTFHLLEIHPNINQHLRLGLPSGLLPSGFPTKTLYTPLSSPVCATCPAHLILLDFITRTILGEEYRSSSSSLCNLLHSPVSLPLPGPNILCT